MTAPRTMFMTLAVLLTLAPGVAAGQMPPDPVRVAEVAKEEVQNRTRVTGNLRACARAVISAREEGHVLEILVREAMAVRKDDLLVRMDTRRLDAQIATLRAELKVARSLITEREAEIEQEIRELKRMLEMLATKAAPQRDADMAQSRKLISEAKLEQARLQISVIENRIQLLDIRRADLELRAPFDGVVVAKHIENGSWAKSGDAAVTLISNGPIEAWLEVPERMSNQGAMETKPRIDVAATGESYAATSIRLLPLVDPRARTFMLIATIDPGKSALVPGMSVTADLPNGDAEPKLTLPRDALIREPTGFYVYKIKQGNQGGALAVPARLRVLFEFEGKACVESTELEAGDQVIVEGNERLRPMTPVRILENTPNGSSVSVAK